MSWPSIPLEDTFGDCLRKAMRGNSVDTRGLATETGIPAQDIEAWLSDRGRAGAEQARAIAAALHLDASSLVERAADSWAPPPIELPNVRRHQQPYPSNGYVFFRKRAALVDPSGHPGVLPRLLRDAAYDLQYILITHKHADHCDAAADVAAAFPDARIVMHKIDVPAIGNLGRNAIRVKDGDELPFGDDATIRVLHTPGHTDGSVCFLFESALFTGDTLFAGSVGGAYGDDSTYADILESIRSKIFTLPGDTALMPGHGPPSTVALEREHNVFFPTA
jgi:glyoxylase-like metal-dependent hydrolase (beta-lactamase superfamily II)